ncbi:MAG: hypothetical protein ACPGAP_02330 [Akkermansiaceae bacterium]
MDENASNEAWPVKPASPYPRLTPPALDEECENAKQKAKDYLFHKLEKIAGSPFIEAAYSANAKIRRARELATEGYDTEATELRESAADLVAKAYREAIISDRLQDLDRFARILQSEAPHGKLPLGQILIAKALIRCIQEKRELPLLSEVETKASAIREEQIKGGKESVPKISKSLVSEALGAFGIVLPKDKTGPKGRIPNN